jgi:hypothetical protein
VNARITGYFVPLDVDQQIPLLLMLFSSPSVKIIKSILTFFFPSFLTLPSLAKSLSNASLVPNSRIFQYHVVFCAIFCYHCATGLVGVKFQIKKEGGTLPSGRRAGDSDHGVTFFRCELVCADFVHVRVFPVKKEVKEK